MDVVMDDILVDLAGGYDMDADHDPFGATEEAEAEYWAAMDEAGELRAWEAEQAAMPVGASGDGEFPF